MEPRVEYSALPLIVEKARDNWGICKDVYPRPVLFYVCEESRTLIRASD